MKKIAIIGVLALIIGLGAGGVVSGLGVKADLIEEAHAAADSANAHAAGDESVGDNHAGPVEDSVSDEGHPVAVDDSMSAYAEDGAEDPAVDSVLSAEQAAEALAAAIRETEAAERQAAERQAEIERRRVAEEGARKLSKIFGAMQPQDAANVLQELDNQEIELILQFMSDRLAAQILGLFEPARAAALSRVVLGSSGTGS